MKQTVYKYPLIVDDVQTVTLPVGAKIICIKEQHGDLCLWALVDPNETRTEAVKIRCAGTGHPIEEDVEYIDTVMLRSGYLVFHFFRIK